MEYLSQIQMHWNKEFLQRYLKATKQGLTTAMEATGDSPGL